MVVKVKTQLYGRFNQIIWLLDETMRKMSAGILLLLFVPLSYGVSKDEEISHLLVYVQNSNCIFVRNGKEYSAEDAVVAFPQWASLRVLQ